MSLLHDPHHDGSPLYVSDEAPELGATVTVRVRTSAADPVEAVWLRTTYDAEPVFHPTTSTTTGDVVWWEGELPVHNPVTHYRFLLVRALADGEGEQEWLTGAGLVGHDLPDAVDFRLAAHPPAPDWGRDGVVYQVFPDRFARSAAADEREVPDWALPAEWDDEVVFEGSDPRTPMQLYGGDLDGITEHLDHVAAVGADVLYTTPVFPGESNHRYNATTFTEVDELLGGSEAYARLSAAVHERGWRILGDLTTNHTGDTHEWFLCAVDDARDPHRSFYYFADDGTYANWMGHGTLPKINHANLDVRHAMVDGPDSVVGRWLQPPYAVDGWRIDVANMTGRLGDIDVAHEVARTVRATAAALHDDPWVIGEHNHDASGDVDGDGWHGTMNYSGFSWPVWSWLRDPASPARPFGRPVPVPRRGGGRRRRDVPGLAGRTRLARHRVELEHPRLPRLRPHPHPRRRGRCRPPRRRRPAVHDARRPDDLRRGRDRARGRQRRGRPPPDAVAPPRGVGRADAHDVRRPGAAAAGAPGPAPWRAALGPRRRRHHRLPPRAPRPDRAGRRPPRCGRRVHAPRRGGPAPLRVRAGRRRPRPRAPTASRSRRRRGRDSTSGRSPT